MQGGMQPVFESVCLGSPPHPLTPHPATCVMAVHSPLLPCPAASACSQLCSALTHSSMERIQRLRQLQELQHIKLDGLRFRLIDARGMIVGHLAAEISRILQGKDKPTYNPKHNMGDVVVVINAAHVHFTNDQWHTKLYRWHTGFPGGLRERVAADQWDHDPTSILRNAVRGMLPRNRLRVYRLDKLKLFPEEDHPFKNFPLVPFVPKPRRISLPGLGWPLPPGFHPMNQEKYAFRALSGQQPSDKEAGPKPSGSGKQQQRGELLGLSGLTKLLTPEERAALEQSLKK